MPVANPHRRWEAADLKRTGISHNNRQLQRSPPHAQEPLSSTAYGPAAPKARALPLGHTPRRQSYGFEWAH